MARKVANVDIITDSFEIWLLETNELLHALSTEIITANTTYANTGNSTISRTAQLWGTFGANNLIVSDWLRGGNVTGQYANLNISTNTVISNNSYSNLQFKVANSTVFSYVTPIGGYFGNTVANSYINTTAIITQSNATVNTNISPTQVQVTNSTYSANMTSSSFKTGIFQANTIEMQVGANLVANSMSLYIGNSTINAVHTQSNSHLANAVHSADLSYERLLIGNSSINALANSTLITIANSTSSANVDPISFKTGIFTGNTIAMSVGANLIANSSTLYVGNATINTIVGQTNTTITNGAQSTFIGVANAQFGNSTVNSFANSTFQRVVDTTSSANMTSTAFTTGIFTGNTIAMSVGANVIANSTAFFAGNSTINAVHTQSSTQISNATQSTIFGAATGRLGNTSVYVGGNSTLWTTVDAGSSANVTSTAFKTGIFTGNTTAVSVGANVIANATSYLVGNSTVNVVVTAGDIASAANLTVTTTKATFSNAVTVTGNTILSNTLRVTGNSAFSNTLDVTGATSLSNTLAVTGTTSLGSAVTVMSDLMIDVSSNANIGANTTTPQLLYTFPKATFSSAKITVQVKNNSNTQISEMVLAHDGSTAYVTVYGTVASPPAANGTVSPLGTFIANINTTNVELLLNQTRANSAVKVVAHLIK